MEYTKRNTSNDSLGLNYKGLTSFLSTNNSNIIQFLEKNGYNSKVNSVINNNTVIMDSLLGIKRIYTPMNLNVYDKIGQYDCSSIDGLFYDLGKMKCNIYDNKNALGLGYMITYDEKRYLKQIKSKETNVFENPKYFTKYYDGNDIKYFNHIKLN